MKKTQGPERESHLPRVTQRVQSRTGTCNPVVLTGAKEQLACAQRMKPCIGGEEARMCAGPTPQLCWTPLMPSVTVSFAFTKTFASSPGSWAGRSIPQSCVMTLKVPFQLSGLMQDIGPGAGGAWGGHGGGGGLGEEESWWVGSLLEVWLSGCLSLVCSHSTRVTFCGWPPRLVGTTPPPTRGHLAISGDIFGCHDWGEGLLLASIG